MPYIAAGTPQKDYTASGVIDVYHSNNVFANFVPVAVWRDPQGAEAAVMSQILGPNFLSDGGTIALDGDIEPALVDKQQQALVAAGYITQADLDAGNKPVISATDTSTGTVTSSTFTATTVDPGQTTFPDSYVLSASYTLGSMTKAPGVVFTHAVEPSVGLSTAQIVGNLQLLTLNCVEPLKAYRPDMFITNSFRPAGIGSTTSQHPKGMACDMQFSKAGKADYFTIAQWLRDNVPYDQLLLEYKTTGSKLPWIHISYNGANNRRQVMTFMNDKKSADGLVDLSST